MLYETGNKILSRNAFQIGKSNSLTYSTLQNVTEVIISSLSFSDIPWFKDRIYTELTDRVRKGPEIALSTTWRLLISQEQRFPTPHKGVVTREATRSDSDSRADMFFLGFR